MNPRQDPAPRPRVGVSSCLLGEAVRWNGAHKLDPCLTEILGPLFEWVPVCPEVEIGLGVPREAIRLEGDPDSPRLVGRTTGIDLTDRMEAFARDRVERLAALDLCGYVLKSESPSCGAGSVPVFVAAEATPGAGTGLFARALLRRLPFLPVEEETRLHDPDVRETFVARVRAFGARRPSGDEPRA